MPNAKLFRTYVVTWPSQASQIDGVGVHGAWRFTAREDASYHHWVDKNERGRATLYGEVTETRIRLQEASDNRCQEILIEAEDEGVATNVATLLQIGTLLGYPDMTLSPNYFGASKVNPNLEGLMSQEPFCNNFTFQENALFGSRVALASWAEPSLKYAIEKYKLSLELDSFTPHSASPRYGQVFLNQHPEYSYHVKAATAVLVAFSVIEELGLEIRSSSKNKRFNDVSKGEWNPSVKEDTEERLKEQGVDLSESVQWIYRGGPSPMELDIKPNFGVLAKDADGDTVRDRKIEVIDALHKASYIRNFVVAHKYSQLVKVLGPYDVHNVQLLARRLILSSLGLYKKF